MPAHADRVSVEYSRTWTRPGAGRYGSRILHSKSPTTRSLCFRETDEGRALWDGIVFIPFRRCHKGDSDQRGRTDFFLFTKIHSLHRATISSIQ
jgi:hypothetical protein